MHSARAREAWLGLSPSGSVGARRQRSPSAGGEGALEATCRATSTYKVERAACMRGTWKAGLAGYCCVTAPSTVDGSHRVGDGSWGAGAAAKTPSRMGWGRVDEKGGRERSVRLLGWPRSGRLAGTKLSIPSFSSPRYVTGRFAVVWARTKPSSNKSSTRNDGNPDLTLDRIALSADTRTGEKKSMKKKGRPRPHFQCAANVYRPKSWQINHEVRRFHPGRIWDPKICIPDIWSRRSSSHPLSCLCCGHTATLPQRRGPEALPCLGREPKWLGMAASQQPAERQQGNRS